MSVLFGINGMKIISTPEESTSPSSTSAEGSLGEGDLAAWFTKHAVPL
jgi:hypothetical protein